VRNRVVQLKPKAVPFDVAIAAYRSARYDDCLAALDAHTGTQARTLAVRALSRLGRADAALALCSTEPGLPISERAELSILKTIALIRLGRTDEAEAEILQARVFAYSSCSAAIEADYERVEAHLRFYRHDLAGASAAVDRALAVGPAPQAWQNHDREYFLSLRLVRASVYDLRGQLARAKEGLRAQLHWAQLALAELDADPHEDEWLRATLLSNFAVLASDAGDPSLREELRQRASTIEWSNDAKLQHFFVMRALGWLSALNGDHLGAFRDFRASAELAPSRAWKMHAVLDRSLLARELKQDVFAEDELNHALELAGELDLAAPTRDPFPSFSALLKLAELAAERDPAEGRAILNRYRAARSKCPSALFDGGDRRWQASELMSEGIVARAEGRTQLATDLLINAFDAFDKLGSRWRAALAALELAAMTGQPFFYGYAAREAGGRPQSWMARRLAQLEAEQRPLEAPFK
jgi:hypothetical protein